MLADGAILDYGSGPFLRDEINGGLIWNCFAPGTVHLGQGGEVTVVASVADRWLAAAEAYELFRRSVPGSGSDAPIPYWAYYTAALKVHGLHFGVGQAQVFMSEGSLPAELGFQRIAAA